MIALVFGMIASVGYAAESGGGSSIGLTNSGSPDNEVAPVPEPSVTVLVVLGLVGVATLTLRRISIG